MKFKVGDRVRVIEEGFEGIIEEVIRVEHQHYSYNSGTFSYMYRVSDEYKYFHGLDESELELIEKAKEPTTLEDLKQRIEKLEKAVFKPVEMYAKPEETKPSLLTEDERVILRNIDKRYEWITKDIDGDLYVF